MRINEKDVKRVVKELELVKRSYDNNNRTFPALIEAFVEKEEAAIMDCGLDQFMDQLVTLHYNNKDIEVVETLDTIVEMLNSLYEIYLKHDQLRDNLTSMISDNHLASTHIIKDTFACYADNTEDDEW